MTEAAALPPGVTVLERGWLSSNNVLFHGEGVTALVDSGYVSHADQTVALVRGGLGERRLQRLVNTHLHSDHCGGNARLQSTYPELETLVPPGEAQAVEAWDEARLSYRSTGQRCDRFGFDGLLMPGDEVQFGDRPWTALAAPGHDPDSLILFEPLSRCLISADALWGNGFGVVFPQIEGASGFKEVGSTLDLIESLEPAVVIPGHGRVFTDVASALRLARTKLAKFEEFPDRHAAHAAKVLIKFRLLDWQTVSRRDFERWLEETPYLRILARRFGSGDEEGWIRDQVDGLAAAGALVFKDDKVLNG